MQKYCPGFCFSLSLMYRNLVSILVSKVHCFNFFFIFWSGLWIMKKTPIMLLFQFMFQMECCRLSFCFRGPFFMLNKLSEEQWFSVYIYQKIWHPTDPLPDTPFRLWSFEINGISEKLLIFWFWLRFWNSVSASWQLIKDVWLMLNEPTESFAFF